MAEDAPLSKVVKTRKELEQHHLELDEIAVVIANAKKEEDPVPMTIHQVQTTNRQLTDLHTRMREAILMISRNETVEDLRADDNRHRIAIMNKWDNLNQNMMEVSNQYKAEKFQAAAHSSIKSVERKQIENPTKNYKEAISTINTQLVNLKEALELTELSKEHNLWTEHETLQDRMYDLMAFEPPPPDVKDIRKVHDKGSYKVSALAIPKFNGKIQGWVAFWQEFEYAIHKKKDMDDAVKMVYLKQAVTDPGLNTTILE